MEVVNGRNSDKVAMLSHCGAKTAQSVGLSEPSNLLNANTAVFRWPEPLELSDADMESGLELCWKAVEDEAAPSDSLSDYSAKFGTVSIRGMFSS